MLVIGVEVDGWFPVRLRFHTLQPVNSPLLKLFESDFRRWRRVVQVQAMRILLLLVDRRSELSFFMVDSRPAFRVNPIRVLSNHGVSYEKP